MRARIVLACAEGLQSKQVAGALGSIRPPSTSGTTASSRIGWTGCATSHARERRERSTMRASRR
jgi:hypothetical protein